MFFKLFNIFGAKDAYESSLIRITFIDQQHNNDLCTGIIGQEYLPDFFSPPLHIMLDSKPWIVVKATPAHVLDYSFDKKLVLELLPAIDNNDIQLANQSKYRYNSPSTLGPIVGSIISNIPIS